VRDRAQLARQGWTLAGLAGVAALIFAWMVIRPPARPVLVPPPPVPDPAEDLPLDRVSERARALFEAGHHQESIPYFRRLAHDLDHNWGAFYNYSAALHNAALETRIRLGRKDPAVRSSYERVRMEHQALGVLDLAERRAPKPHERGLVIDQRGQRLHIWGFPVDALRELERAQALEPGSRQFQADLDEALAIMREGHGEKP
jgi:tetratricopeptide (TPR) repeat protein